ncbi:MAG: hypothetical protein LKK00_01690 [Intestinimonas sp.]|nr:hypothetical protein [Intestinimonas sp.]
MKCLMRYAITSGRVVEKRDVLMEINLDPTKKRTRGRRRAKSAEKQIERNGNETVLRLARILNSNFKGGDLFLTLKYDNGRLPDTLEEAKRLARNFMNRIARAYQKTTGEKLRWVLVTADRSAKTGEPVRLHHHIVMDAVDWELISKHWPADQFSYRRLDGSGDYIGVARYMVRNAGYVRGRRTWSSSQGLEKPVFSEPVPVKKAGSYRVPKEAKGIYREVKEDSESGFYAAYIRYVMPKETRTDDPQHNAERYGRETGKIRNTEARG